MQETQDTWVQFLDQKDPLTKEDGNPPTPVFLPGKSHGQRSLVGYTVHAVAKSRLQLSD